jgi:hypothetical protein
MDLSFCGAGSSQQESENWGIATISANLSRRIAHNALRGRRTVSVCTALKCAKRGRFAYFALKLALMGTATGLHRSINQKAVASGNCQCQMKQEATLIRARLKTSRVPAIAGILFSVLMITGLLLFRIDWVLLLFPLWVLLISIYILGFRIPTLLVNARTNQKPKRSRLITREQWPGPLTKFRSRKSEADSPIDATPNATLRSLHLAGLSRGLARCSGLRT